VAWSSFRLSFLFLLSPAETRFGKHAGPLQLPQTERTRRSRSVSLGPVDITALPLFEMYLNSINLRVARDSYREPWGAAASANGLPSESRQTAHRSPGWMTEPPSSRTRSSDAGRSLTVK
jgi:hypothetical protein